MLPRTILVPIDLGPASEPLLAYATELAGKLGATVHPLHVVALPMLGGDLGMAIEASMVTTLVARQGDQVERLIRPLAGRAGLAATMLEVGDAREQIVEACRKIAADLVVMGTHGRRGPVRWLLGSVAESVVRTAPCPVLLVR